MSTTTSHTRLQTIQYRPSGSPFRVGVQHPGSTQVTRAHRPACIAPWQHSSSRTLPLLHSVALGPRTQGTLHKADVAAGSFLKCVDESGQMRVAFEAPRNRPRVHHSRLESCGSGAPQRCKHVALCCVLQSTQVAELKVLLVDLSNPTHQEMLLTVTSAVVTTKLTATCDDDNDDD